MQRCACLRAAAAAALSLLLLVLCVCETASRAAAEDAAAEDAAAATAAARAQRRRVQYGEHGNGNAEEDGDGDRDVLFDVFDLTGGDDDDDDGANAVDLRGEGPTKSQLANRGDAARVLVPQLWPNYTGPPEPPAESVPCDTARLKCGYRAGCGMALQNYVLGCSDLVSGNSTKCSSHCRHSLIALMSTHEGQRLMKCNCSGSSSCERSKSQLGACELEVRSATRTDAVVTCTAAQWICAADPLCAKAIEYYNRFCGAMFRGRRCTTRCLNSIAILRRQAASAKLHSCRCDGTEPYRCHDIKANMERLCFRQGEGHDNDHSISGNEVDVGSAAAAADSHLGLWTALLVIAKVNSLDS